MALDERQMGFGKRGKKEREMDQRNLTICPTARLKKRAEERLTTRPDTMYFHVLKKQQQHVQGDRVGVTGVALYMCVLLEILNSSFQLDFVVLCEKKLTTLFHFLKILCCSFAEKKL